MNYKTALEIYEKADRIRWADDLTSDEKYDLIFSKDISQRVSFDYYDPDTSYEEDVHAFMRGFEEYVDKLKRIEKYL